MTIQFDRLLNLRRVMAEVAAKPSIAYSIDNWGRKFDSVKAMQEYFGKLEEVPPCHTVACTAGWAGLDPWFQEQGFKTFQSNDDIKTFDMEIPKENERSHYQKACDLNVTKRELAFMEFFGINFEEAISLFYKGPPYESEDGEPRRTVKVQDIVQYLDTVLIPKYRTVQEQT